MGVLTYSPLAGGWLSGRWHTATDLPTPSPARQRLVKRYDMSLPAWGGLDQLERHRDTGGP